MKSVILTTIFLLLNFLSVEAAEEFKIEVVRVKVEGDALTGELFLNGTKIGPTLENEEFRIPPGTYKGVMRYQSSKYFVQGPNGQMDNTGDFLLEIAGVKDWKGRPRTSILFHGGTKPSHSEGCILLGPVSKTKNGERYLEPNHPLVTLREKFYGTNNPNSSPNKSITIIVTDLVSRRELTPVVPRFSEGF